MSRGLAFAVLMMVYLCGYTQEIKRFNPDTLETIQLDSVVNIKAQKFGTETFINAIITDNSFYQAFRNMKKYGFTAENRIYTYDKKNKVDGRIYRKIKHHASGPKKWNTC